MTPEQAAALQKGDIIYNDQTLEPMRFIELDEEGDLWVVYPSAISGKIVVHRDMYATGADVLLASGTSARDEIYAMVLTYLEKMSYIDHDTTIEDIDPRPGVRLALYNEVARLHTLLAEESELDGPEVITLSKIPEAFK